MTVSDVTVIAAHFPQKWGGQPTLKTLFFIKIKMALKDSIDGKFQATSEKKNYQRLCYDGRLWEFFGDVYPKLKTNIFSLGLCR